MPQKIIDTTPDRDCADCPRLKEFRLENRQKFPDKFNAPVPSFGPVDAEVLIVGLAPGLKGANFTGRPFTGDFAGDLLYETLVNFGLARGTYDKRPDDGLELVNCRITNAVRCVPPQNKPTGFEINQCRPFLIEEFKALSRLRVVIALGTIAHNTILKTCNMRQAAYKFGHTAEHEITLPPDGRKIALIDSYHCSRYNTNTGRLTPEMFNDVFEKVKSVID